MARPNPEPGPRYEEPFTEAFRGSSCAEPAASGYRIVGFYVLAVVFGALVMPSLLVAVITAAVKESAYEVGVGVGREF